MHCFGRTLAHGRAKVERARWLGDAGVDAAVRAGPPRGLEGTPERVRARVGVHLRTQRIIVQHFGRMFLLCFSVVDSGVSGFRKCAVVGL